MRLFLTLALSLAGYAASADQAAVIAQLEAKGGVVEVTDGVVTELRFDEAKPLVAEDWQAIGTLTDLRRLTAHGTARSLNDDTIGYLADLDRLEVFSVDRMMLSDAGLAGLAELESLRRGSFFHLSFLMEGFTGEGFSALASLENLESLTLAGMSIGDAGVETVARLPHLTEFRIWHTRRTPKSTPAIAAMPLKRFKIGQRLPNGGGRAESFSDASLPLIAGMTSVEFLELTEARLSLEALMALKDMPNLKVLKINRVEIPPEDIETLQAAMPGVEIRFRPITDAEREKLAPYFE